MGFKFIFALMTQSKRGFVPATTTIVRKWKAAGHMVPIWPTLLASPHVCIHHVTSQHNCPPSWACAAHSMFHQPMLPVSRNEGVSSALKAWPHELGLALGLPVLHLGVCARLQIVLAPGAPNTQFSRCKGMQIDFSAF